MGPYVLDARRCISYLTIELKGLCSAYLRPLIGNHIFGCDICQEIRPYNVKARPTTEKAYAPREGLYAPDLIPLLSLDEEEFRTALRQPDPSAKRKDYCATLRLLSAMLKESEALLALIRALDDEETLVRGHVAWALGQSVYKKELAPLKKVAHRVRSDGQNGN